MASGDDFSAMASARYRVQFCEGSLIGILRENVHMAVITLSNYVAVQHTVLP